MDALVTAWRAGRGNIAEAAKRNAALLLLPSELEKRCKAVEEKIRRAEREAGGNLEQTKVRLAGLAAMPHDARAASEPPESTRSSAASVFCHKQFSKG